MPIVRLREVNCNQDKEVPDIDSKSTLRLSRAHLLASIAYLRHKSSTKMLKDSKKLIHQSCQLIFETEFSFMKDDWGPSYRSRQSDDRSSIVGVLLYAERRWCHWTEDNRDKTSLHAAYIENTSGSMEDHWAVCPSIFQPRLLTDSVRSLWTTST